jgi:D-3-phosphoglycerate dehydrogenase / 2-oxoglutarate reductase
LKILVVGDSFVPVSVFKKGFGRVEQQHDVEFLQLDESRKTNPRSDSTGAIREFLGTPDEIVERIGDAEILVVHGAPVTGGVLDAGRKLKLVCCARGGPVNVDIEAASARGIPVVNTPGKNADAVADQTLAFMIMLARGFPRAQRFLLDGGRLGESAYEGAQFLGHELGGHRLGLVGYGNVGRRVATRAVAFGVDVVVFDPYVHVKDGPGVRQVDSLHELLAVADFVSIHVRASAATENLMGPEQFGAMKSGSYFVNTARETLVDEEALFGALRSGHLAGAALDVVRSRPNHGRHPLLGLDNVVITPHIGGATHETLLRGVTMVAAEIERFVKGEPMQSVVNRAAVGA